MPRYKMLKQIQLSMIVLSLISGTLLLANGNTPVIDLDNNPYIELYRLRIAQAEANLRRQESLVQLATGKFDRAKKLLVSRAISQEEYDTLSSDASVASTDLELAGKKLEEARAYFQIVEALVKRGVSIPLCTYEME